MAELAETMACLNCGGGPMAYMEPDDDDDEKGEEGKEGINEYMCEECGEEQTDVQWNFRGYKVGKVIEVKAMKSPLKKCRIIVKEGDEDGLQIVTNAKHIDEGDMVIVATQGAIVPAGSGEDGTVVKQATVGGEKSEAMLCDGVMLRWKGGSKGVLAKLIGDYRVGDVPPANKPNKKK
eukprot:CAMPEP_0114507122 /NCGR_PEP_ID=MMETSP0109-20121206/11834_1 /TAXON_ID=29199 /ORGANISM="Chlorarachnion reptans, Strain CCCM449" /LENGTH=177 /DNA_ID=CAMNT_0001685839 /DNA_START=109 /DNA_END=642 /DNA_ORIENTATION=-